MQLVDEPLLAYLEINPLRDPEQVELRFGKPVEVGQVTGELGAARQISLLPPDLSRALTQVSAGPEERHDRTRSKKPRDVPAMLAQALDYSHGD